ncbi:uncharacterized protein Z520_06383 [Fonsecaea multimorphosa CBS 102226]|uniref:Cupin 2 conserved barrel domain-containing protein n=1 Tax=Fonsecaea multimorphosa CBS 102226 TaxID=1442371 RepID=A0A0D2H6V8_9EURO|nr:uncharacterized protein Z520_06383 [Fonsecaea multimorphosa CBS 102226]KIX97605.1 hypothetical protein Z520_06383 [Fonsecaea multimorphosa CBS 102226]OAL24070.1 hypothetical protein AYO22_05951 [Fonsecaea multimorphosa]
MIVTEILDGIPVDDSVRTVRRNEVLLTDIPDPAPMNLWRDYPLLGAINLPVDHVPGKFMVPQGVFESDEIRLEYTRLMGRQPFYHRNADADEIAYHVTGTRQVLTELGTVDMEPGDFVRIPVGVSHDNNGIDDVHILFYIPQDVKEVVNPCKTAEYRMPPYPGWEQKNSVEFITEHLGEVGSDHSVFYTDEKMLLDNAKSDPSKMYVVRASGIEGTEWLYKSENIWIGSTMFSRSDATTYVRHRQADEIQIQTQGRRTLISQRGCLELEPGDFIAIPKGCAFTNIANEKNEYITCILRHPAAAKKPFTKIATQDAAERLAVFRGNSNGTRN